MRLPLGRNTLILIACCMAIVAAARAQDKPAPATEKEAAAYTASYKKAYAAISKPCVAAADEQCPDAQWMADYLKYKALLAKYTIPPELLKKYKMPQEVQDQANGWAMRLNQARPAGYNWDEAKLRWVKAPPAPAPQPAPEKK